MAVGWKLSLRQGFSAVRALWSRGWGWAFCPDPFQALLLEVTGYLKTFFRRMFRCGKINEIHHLNHLYVGKGLGGVQPSSPIPVTLHPVKLQVSPSHTAMAPAPTVPLLPLWM